MGSGDGSGRGTMVTRPCQCQERTALGRHWALPWVGSGSSGDQGVWGGGWATVEAPRRILGKISVTSVSPPGREALFLGGIFHC